MHTYIQWRLVFLLILLSDHLDGELVRPSSTEPSPWTKHDPVVSVTASKSAGRVILWIAVGVGTSIFEEL